MFGWIKNFSEYADQFFNNEPITRKKTVTRPPLPPAPAQIAPENDLKKSFTEKPRKVASNDVREVRKQNKKDGPDEWTVRYEEKSWNTSLESLKSSAAERVKKVTDLPAVDLRASLPFQVSALDQNHRQLLFINPGHEKIEQCKTSLRRGWTLPPWAKSFEQHITLSGNRLMYRDFRLADGMDEKRKMVKAMFFDPKEPATINPLVDRLREMKWGNISRRDVTTILKSFEAYQINAPRRRPPKVMGKMVMNGPGLLACDMFFPSKRHGWRKVNCLTMMDTWSRFTRCYPLLNKKYETVRVAMDQFTREFASLGHVPRLMLADKGTDLAPAKEVMRKYRRKKDGTRPMVIHTQTGTPVNIVEALNAQIERRMALFSTAGITDDASLILRDITDQINSQKRPDRANMTPMQLLSLSPEQRVRVNEFYDKKSRNAAPVEVPGLPPVFVGDTVRLLMMTRKEQAKNSVKGFAPKWSRELFEITKKTRIQKNRDVYRYRVAGGSYYRHELLLIQGGKVDKEVIDVVSGRKEQIIDPEENWSDLDWDSDDSRA